MSNRLRGRFPNRSSNRVPSWVLTAGGVPASLDIDFVNDRAYSASPSSIPILLSCTRASSGYYTNADGTLTSFADNTLRYGTNGLLIEEQRINFLYYSQQLDNAWYTKDSISVIADQTTSPVSGEVSPTADFIKLNALNATHRLLPTAVASSSGSSYACSYYVKANGYSKVAIRDGVNGGYAAFDLDTGTVLDTSSATATITALANGWYRIVAVVTAYTTIRPDLWVLSPSYTSGSVIGTWTSDGVSGIYAWGAQAELGAFATSYAATTTSSAQRNSDVPTLTAPFNNTVGACYAQAKQFGRTASSGQVLTNAGASLLYIKSSGIIAIYDGTSNAQTSGAPSLDVSFKAASNWGNSGNKRAVLNGSDGQTNSFDGAMGAPSSTLYVGNIASGTEALNGHVLRLALWSGVVVDADIDQITT